MFILNTFLFYLFYVINKYRLFCTYKIKYLKLMNGKSTLFRISEENQNEVTFCGVQGCCPKMEQQENGSSKMIGDDGQIIEFTPDQLKGLKEYLNTLEI